MVSTATFTAPVLHLQPQLFLRCCPRLQAALTALEAVVRKDGSRVEPAVLQSGERGQWQPQRTKCRTKSIHVFYVHVPSVTLPCFLPSRHTLVVSAAPAAALEEAATLVNEGDLLVTALSLGFATTALREQPACADVVVDKARQRRRGGVWWGWHCGPLSGCAGRLGKAGGVSDCIGTGASMTCRPSRCCCFPTCVPNLGSPHAVQVLPQALALVKSPLLQGEHLPAVAPERALLGIFRPDPSAHSFQAYSMCGLKSEPHILVPVSAT